MGDQTPAAGRYTFSTNAELGGAGLRLYGVHGTHTLGGLYEHTARVATTQPEGLDDDALDALLSGYARFGPARTTEGQTWGVVRHVAMLPMLPRASDAWVTAYELELVPKLWRLTLTRRSHAYAAGTHLEIVKAILAEHGLTEGNFVEDRCEETYAPREMTVQYDETDYDFALRLCQHNGIHLHFVQGEGTEKLVLGDRNGAFDALPEHDALEHSTLEVPPTDEAPVVWGLRRHRRPRPRSVVVRDYNWRTPQ
ncbi:MAG: hypothetical protein K8H88_16050, partial [Sandaracinaceae bacterium]|nr:hypothetical protein [Sandaracinaceae bacterium]